MASGKRLEHETLEYYHARLKEQEKIDRVKKRGKWLTRKPGLAERIAIEQAKKEQEKSVSQSSAEQEGAASGESSSEAIGEMAESIGSGEAALVGEVE